MSWPGASPLKTVCAQGGARGGYWTGQVSSQDVHPNWSLSAIGFKCSSDNPTRIHSISGVRLTERGQEASDAAQTGGGPGRAVLRSSGVLGPAGWVAGAWA